MTKFKVGDRVRLTGEQWKREEMHDEIVEIVGIDRGDGDAKFKYGGDTWWVYSRGDDYTATLVEPAPPVDTRKRLREYTDLADGDVVVIAGVPMTVNAGVLEQDGCEPEWHVYANMLVDEVRRKPRMRRVFEEIDVRDVRAGDLIVYEDGRIVVDKEDGRTMHKVATVYRLVEETEVPR